jgi:hypothetical protein
MLKECYEKELINWAKENGSDDLKHAIKKDYPTGDHLAREYLFSVFDEIQHTVRVYVPAKSTTALSIIDTTMPSKEYRELLEQIETINNRFKPPTIFKFSTVGRISDVTYDNDTRTVIPIEIKCESNGIIETDYLFYYREFKYNPFSDISTITRLLNNKNQLCNISQQSLL